MYAIVEIAGQQFKVEKKQEIFVHRLEETEGAKIEFSDVLLIDDKGKINVGTPTISGAVVSAKVLEHVQGDKVLVFKKKRRKGYQKLNGHRQQFTKIEISDILEKAPKAAAKKEEKEAAPKATPKAAAKPAVKKAAPKAETTEKKAAPKAKKPAAKTETKKAAPKPKAETKKAAPVKEEKPKAAPKAKKADEEKKEDK